EEREAPSPRARRPDDALSAETAIRNTLNRTWMHGRLWANDPDCLLVRTDRTKLTLDETRTLASVIGLSAGMMLSSDDLDKLTPERLDIISMLLPVLPHAARPVDLIERDMPERYELAFEREFERGSILGAFNFDDAPKDVLIELPEGRWHAFELWSERSLGIVEGTLSFDSVPPRGCRVLALRSAREEPQFVATTAHIGMGMLDISNVRWDAEERTLTLDLAPAGRRQRTIVLAANAMQARAAQLDTRRVDLTQAADEIRIDVTVDAPARLDVEFA
ncbi:MAG TPA: hypothetical protein VFH62_00730, partial [Dehalococcoidia bacterium]|nr:hypothetical protein [Dehalococcoidia bacterium]